METVVALLRNGLCVVADTFPESHWLRLPLKAFQENEVLLALLPPSTRAWLLSPNTLFGEVSALSACISALQLCAVLFNLNGARQGLPRALRAYARAKEVEVRLARKAKSEALALGAERAVLRERSNVMYGVVRLLLAPSFFVLSMFTLKQSSQHTLEWALLCMQIALALALWAMWLDLGWRRRKAEYASDLAVNKTETTAQKLAFVDLQEGHAKSLVAVVDSCYDEDSPEAAGERCDAWVAAARRFAEENPDDLKRVARTERQLAVVDSLVWVLNAVAFFGYLVFPVTYFGPFDRDPYFEWLGNFAGDLAWTIEPAIVLVAACGFFTSSMSSSDKSE